MKNEKIKKEPPPEKRPHLEGSFCTVGFFNRLISTKETSPRKKGQGRDSNPKSRVHSTACYLLHYLVSVFFKDTLSRTRTGDPWIKSPTLYLLSYEGAPDQFKPPSGSRRDSSEPSGDPPHVCCTPNGNLCGWVGCAGCSLWPGVGWCGTG